MLLSNEGLLVIILTGIVAGWLAGKIVDGGGFGLIGDLVMGIIGAFIGDWLLPRLNIHLGVGIVTLSINATLGAIVLLVIPRVVMGRGSRWGRSSWREIRTAWQTAAIRDWRSSPRCSNKSRKPPPATR
jgi:uncharacterized membrane protein YeaQ/YmgE (transglycosylase-associated protein family)